MGTLSTKKSQVTECLTICSSMNAPSFSTPGVAAADLAVSACCFRCCRRFTSRRSSANDRPSELLPVPLLSVDGASSTEHCLAVGSNDRFAPTRVKNDGVTNACDGAITDDHSKKLMMKTDLFAMLNLGPTDSVSPVQHKRRIASRVLEQPSALCW